MKKQWYHDSFWHQPLIDLWTIPHVVFGMIPALAFAYAGANMLFGLVATTIIAILWEIGEVICGVSSDEVFSNKVSDVIVAMIGYCLIWALVRAHLPAQSTIGYWLVILVVVLIVTSTIGWIGYHLWHTSR